jgi:hypothetical protein
MAIKFTGENAPIVVFDMINRGAKPKLVHEMGRSIEKDYDYEKAVALEKFMRDKKWSNGQMTIAMISELCRNRLFVDDLRMAADVFGGQAVSKGRTSWKVH